MTNLCAASVLIDVLGRDGAGSNNPEADMGRPAATREGGTGALSWLRASWIGKSLIARKANRDLTRAVARLSELSPHLLADIGVLDTPDLGDDWSAGTTSDALPAGRKTTAPAVPVALRPALRPAIVSRVRAPAPAATKAPVRAARKEQPAAQ